VVLHFLVTHPLSALAVDGNGMLLMLAIGTISTVIPAYCISAAIGLVGPERTAIIGNVSPIVTVGLAVGILSEAFTEWHAAARRWCCLASGCSEERRRQSELMSRPPRWSLRRS